MTVEKALRFAAIAGVVTVLLGLQPAFAEPFMYIPLGGDGKIVVSSADAAMAWGVDRKSLVVLGEIPIGGTGRQLAQGAGS